MATENATTAGVPPYPNQTNPIEETTSEVEDVIDAKTIKARGLVSCLCNSQVGKRVTLQ